MVLFSSELRRLSIEIRLFFVVGIWRNQSFSTKNNRKIIDHHLLPALSCNHLEELIERLNSFTESRFGLSAVALYLKAIWLATMLRGTSYRKRRRWLPVSRGQRDGRCSRPEITYAGRSTQTLDRLKSVLLRFGGYSESLLQGDHSAWTDGSF
jgi:hypothetical protein